MGEKIGFIGVGRMGSSMVARLIAAGHELTIYDPVATAAATAAALGGNGGLARDAATTTGGAAGESGCSSSGPAVGPAAPPPAGWAWNYASMLVTRFLFGAGEAGCFPNLTKAFSAWLPIKDRTRAPEASGPAPAMRRVRPILEVLGKVYELGEKPGLGQTVKLANNLMSAASLAIAAEALAMGVKAGVDPAAMLDVLNASSGRNSATQDKIPKHVLNRKFDFGFSNALSFKDVRLCLDEAEALGVPMVVGAAVRQMLSITQQMHGAAADCTDLVKVVENWAGCRIGAQEE